MTAPKRYWPDRFAGARVRVAPNLYRQPGTDRYRFARMKGRPSRSTNASRPSTLTEAKAQADAFRSRIASEGGAFVRRQERHDRSARGELSRARVASACEIIGTHGRITAEPVEASRRFRCSGRRQKPSTSTRQALRRMIDKLNEKRLAGSSVRACVSTASAVFRHGVRDLGAIPRNPVRDLDRDDRPSAKASDRAALSERGGGRPGCLMN